ncbi:DUF4352 domain-containing protein [Catellatospora sichuanensis]|uniref:DUF4352 domain-containing protein n=1 Tax=Catellatospora sichuanensis TaxID=1969805 RepID=UPI0011844196|nr:DUF4352 domain-containing protein [Catellatospora sichuanensis]
MSSQRPALRRPVLTVTLVLAAAVGLACGVKPQQSNVTGSTPAASAPAASPGSAPTAKLGQSIETSGGLGDNRVAYTVSKLTRHTVAPDSSLVRPKKGVFVAIAVEVKVTAGKTYACFCDFALVAADGTLFEPVLPFGFDAGMQSVTLNTGEKAGGVVVFDLPKDAADGVRVQLRPDITNDVRGYWAA